MPIAMKCGIIVESDIMTILFFFFQVSFLLGMITSNFPGYKWLFVKVVSCYMTAMHDVDCVLMLFLFHIISISKLMYCS
jgi:hypothetical protein